MPFRVKFDNGKSAVFANKPTQQDIEEAFQQIRGQQVQFGGGQTRGGGATGTYGIGGIAKQNLGQAGRDVLANMQNIANVGMFGIPEIVSQKTTGQPFVGGGFARGARPTVGSSMLGFTIGGPGKVISKTGQALRTAIPSTKFWPQVFKGATQGAVIGATQLPTPEEAPTLKQAREQMAFKSGTGALIGGAIPFATRGGIKLIRGTGQLIRAIGGVGRETVKQINRLGYERIVDPVKRQAGYFGDVLIPRVKKSLNFTLNRFSNNTRQFLSKMGVSNRAVNDLKKYGYNNLQNLRMKMQDNTDNLVTRAKQGIDVLVNNAKQKYNVVFDQRMPENIGINMKNTYYILRNELEKLKVVDRQGNVVGEKYPNETIKQLTNIYKDLQSSFAPQGQRRISAIISKADYIRYRTAIEATEGTLPSTNRIVYKLSRTLRNDAVNAFPLLKQTNQEYAKAMNLKENYYDKLNQKTFDRFPKLTLEQRRWLQGLEDSLPNQYKFSNDLRAYHSISEINKALEKNFSDEAIEKSLTAFKDYEKPINIQQNAVRSLYQHLPGGIQTTDDALAHYLGNDIFQERLSAGFAGIAGASRKAAELMTRQYLRSNPYLQQGMQYFAPIAESVKRKVTPF